MRKLSVTDEGEDFYQRAVQLLAGMEDTFARYSGAQRALKGRLKVNLAAIAKSLVIPALLEFQRASPQLEIHVGEPTCRHRR